MSQATIIFHLPGSYIDGERPLPRFYARLFKGLHQRGALLDYTVHERVLLERQVVSDGDFHIVDHGSFRHPRVLNAGLAYVFPFWNLDPWGVRAASSIAARAFAPQAVDADKARGFMQRLAKRLAEGRLSRGKPTREVPELPTGCIAILLQGDDDEGAAGSGYLAREAMVEALLARDDPRPLVIKARQRDRGQATTRWLAEVSARDARVTVTSANIHDIFSAAAVTVTINSPAGIESLFQRVPVVLCGKSDFHHCAVTVRQPDQMDAAIAAATTTKWPFARFLFWYFRLHCLNAASPALCDDFIARIAAAGFGTGRFRLSPPKRRS